MWILSWIVIGLIMGAIARAIMPGRASGGWVVTLIVGVVADATSLRIGLLSVPVARLTVVVLAGALSARPRPSRS